MLCFYLLNDDGLDGVVIRFTICTLSIQIMVMFLHQSIACPYGIKRLVAKLLHTISFLSKCIIS